eukprot:g4470.t1
MFFAVDNASWSCLPPGLAERIAVLLSPTDLQNLRLVNHHWHQTGNLFVRRQRPRSFQELTELSTAFPNLTSVDLTTLDLQNEQQLKTAVSYLAPLLNLKQMTIRWTSDLTLESLANTLPNLQYLQICPGNGMAATNFKKSCSASEMIPLANLRLELLGNLTHLDLSWNQLHMDTLEQITQLPKLHGLNLKNCLGVGDTLLEGLAAMGTIRSLNLSNTGITDDGLMLLNDLQLDQLNLSRCDNVTDDGMFWLQYCRSLQELDISGCHNITSGGLEQLQHLPNLKRLYLQEMKLMDCSSLCNLPVLEMLNLRDCSWVTDSVLSSLALCENLRFLNLRNCSKFTDHGLRSLINGLQKLESINFRGCSQITDDGIALLSALMELRDLDLSFLNQITDRSLLSLSKTSQLNRLVLDWCNQVTCTGLKMLKDELHELHELSIKGCHDVGSEDLVLMTQGGSSIRALDYEHSLCSVSLAEEKQDSKIPVMKHIDSVGCFIGIC